MGMSSEVFLRGKRLVLRPLRPSDADGPYAGWFNDPEVCRYNSHGVRPYLREQALAYIEQARQSRDLILAIEDNARAVHVGNIALQDVHAINRSAEFAIVLGDPEVRGKGFGAEAGLLVVAHGFEALGLHRIGCGTSEDNEGMRKLATALGMREEGRRRAAMWKRGRFVDVIEYGVLADEFARHRAGVTS
jgi:ribosomal-protein-alanine N-acetyltransferase